MVQIPWALQLIWNVWIVLGLTVQSKEKGGDTEQEDDATKLLKAMEMDEMQEASKEKEKEKEGPTEIDLRGTAGLFAVMSSGVQKVLQMLPTPIDCILTLSFSPQLIKLGEVSSKPSPRRNVITEKEVDMVNIFYYNISH